MEAESREIKEPYPMERSGMREEENLIKKRKEEWKTMENNLKRFLSLLLALVMVIGLMPVGHAHAEEQTYLKIAEQVAEVEANASYVICLHGTKNALTNQQGSGAWGTHTLATAACGDFAEAQNLWTLETAEGGYKLKNAGGYLNIERNAANVNETGHIFELVYHGNDGWAIKSLATNEYGNNLGDSGSIGGWSGDGTKFDLYKVVEVSAEEADPFGKLRGLWKKVSVDTETVYDAKEGLFEYAWDNKPGTHWHSNWQGASDKLNGSNTFTGVIDFGQAYVIDQFSFLPRQDGNNSGQVTQASLYVREHEGDEWITAAEHMTFEANSSQKDISFPVQAVRYVKFVAEQSNDGWVAVAEFYIDRISPVHEHSWVDATCTAPKTCATCGETEGEALGHKYEGVVTDPDCTNGGYTTYTCSACGDQYVADQTDALGHNYESVVTAPTCTTGGYTTYTCSVCGGSYVADEVPALGHKSGEATREKEVAPTCTAEGSYESVVCCTVCHAELSREIVTVPALGHKDEDNNFLCDVCGEKLCTDHVEEIIKGYAATCTEPGMTDGKKCAICGEILESQVVIDALGHKYEGVVIAPDCVTGGCTTYSCTVCGDTYVADEVPALGHTEEVIPGRDATCTETGLTDGKVCTVCGLTLVYQETIHMLDHTAGEVARENEFMPDCDDAGGYDLVVRCSVCGAEMSREPISVPALGHRNTELRDAVEPTLTQEGYTGDTFCNDCQRIIAFGEVIPVLSTMNAKLLSNGTVVALDNCMYVLGGEANGSYSLSHAGTYYVKPCANGNNVVHTTETFAQLTLETTWEGKAEDDHTIRIKGLDGRDAGAGYIHVWTEGKDQPYWDRCTTAHGPGNNGTDGLYLFYKDGNGGSEIPGYSMVTNGAVKTGESYLIAAQKGEDTWYIMYPSVSTEKFDQIAQVVTDAVTHAHIFTTTTQDATCTTDGLKTDTCDCGHIHTEIIPAVGEHDWVDATCTAPKTCAVCGATEGEALGHTASEAVKEHEKAPTCTETGSYDSVVYCSVCSAELSRETVTVAAEGHKPSEAVRENEVAPTLNSEGSYDEVIYCSVCSAELSRTTVTVPVLEGAVAQVNGVKYATLTEAIEKAYGNMAVHMLSDVTEDIVIDKALILLMNSHTLYGQVKITGPNVQIQGCINTSTDPKGKIVAEGKDAIVIGVKDQKNENISVYANFVDVTSTTDCALLIYDGKATFNNSDLTSTSTSYAAVQGSGRDFGDVSMSLCNVTSEHEVAIYWPHVGTLTVNNDCTITGATGLYIKQGKANLYSCTVKGTGAQVAHKVNNNGGDSTGDAITIDKGATEPVVNTSANLISENGNLVGMYGGTVELFGANLTAKKNAIRMEDGVLTLRGMTINAGYCALFIRGGEVNMSGTTMNSTGDYATIQGNGTCGGDVTIRSGTVSSANNIAIYWPGSGNLTVMDATVTGATAIYAKQGNVTISGGTFRATGEKADFSHSGNGAYATGDAVVLESCDYGTLTASITYGQFISDHGKAVAAYAQPGHTELSGFITGGHYNTEVDAAYLAEGYCAALTGEYYSVAQHYYFSEVTDPDCENGGYTTHTCGRCGDSYVTDEIPALGHTEEVIPGKDATCTETGLTEGKKCTVCGETTVAQQEIPALGHKPGEAVVENEKAASCTETGSYDSVVYCSVCSEELSRETVTVPALGHKDEDRNFECDVCGEDLCTEHTEEIIKGYAATCTEPGLTDGKKCSNCGEILEAQVVIPALGHTPGESVIEDEVAASCTEDGYCVIVTCCTVCGVETSRETVTVEAQGHEYEAVVTAPDCVSGGYTTYTCSVCGDSYVADETSALGHTEEVIPGKDATCTETGLTEGKKCTVCGETTVAQEEIPALGHDWLEDGSCSRCEEKKDDSVTNPFVDIPADEYYLEPVLWAVGKGITSGTSANTFSPYRIITRGEAVTFLWRAMGSPEPVLMINPFVDVTEADYYYKAVLWAAEKGITAGVGNNHFAPGQECTRAQILTFLWVAMGKPASDAEVTFNDVQVGDYYYTAVAWAYEKGITAGVGGGAFGVNVLCNRAQVITFLYRAIA